MSVQGDTMNLEQYNMVIIDKMQKKKVWFTMIEGVWS